jgi:prepilin-type N-terminal cleavage/methylation domain-containing protein
MQNTLSSLLAKTRNSRRSRPDQRGFSLIELMLVLGIIAVLVIGLFALFSQADTSARTSELIKGVAGLNANIRSLYNSQSGYDTGDMIPTLVKANAVPSNWVKGNTLQHGFGGTVTVTGNSSTFSIATDHIPNEVCIRFLSEQGSSSWGSVSVNQKSITSLPVKVADATLECNAGASNNIVLTSQ